MHTIDLAYAGHGIHEELVAHVADQEGYYEDEGVHVAIRDGVHWPVERLRRGATIGLGRSLLSRLTDDIGWTILSVNTHRPLFWFLGGAEVTSMADLRGRRLRDGSLDAAYVGSTLSPEQVAQEEGFHLLAWVGDHFQIPTVGIAIDPVHVPLDSPALQALVRANERALRTLAEQSTLAVDYIAGFLNRVTHDEAKQHYERYVGPYFSADGRVDLDVAQRAIAGVAAELGVAAVDAETVYLTPSPRRSSSQT